MASTPAANCRVCWTAEGPGTTALPESCEDVDVVQDRIKRVLPRLLHSLGLVCPPCRGVDGTSTKGPDTPLCGLTSVRYLAEGTWNAAFLVVPCGKPLSELVFRVALPAITRVSKVAAEVATMEWVRRNTEVPIPEVLAYGDDRTSEIGYEWVLMKKVPGVSYRELEESGSLTREQKVKVARTIADWQHSLACHRFDAIGTPAFGPDGRTPSALGPPVMIELFACDRRNDYDIPRGLFPDLGSFASAIVACRTAESADTRQHLRAEHHEVSELLAAAEAESNGAGTRRLRAYLTHRQSQIEAEATHREELDLAANPLAPSVPVTTSRFALRQLRDMQHTLCPRLAALVNRVFPGPSVTQEVDSLQTFTLQHWDINEDNLLLDPHSSFPTALLDWEHLYTYPIALGERYPSLITDIALSPSVLGPLNNATASASAVNDDQTPDGSSSPSAPRQLTEDEITLISDRKAMRDALDERLKELNSPWLATAAGPGWSIGGFLKFEVEDVDGRGPQQGEGEGGETREQKRVRIARRVMEVVRLGGYDRGSVEALEREVRAAGILDDGPDGGEEGRAGEGEEGRGGDTVTVGVNGPDEGEREDAKTEDRDQDEEEELAVMFTRIDLGESSG